MLLACNEPAQEKQSAAAVMAPATSNIPEKRTKVNEAPVAEYKQRVPDELNEWYFLVRLYETSNTFSYKLKLQYQELRAEDNLTVPNLGIEPVLKLKQGSNPYTCIIGFLDKEGLFHEFKQVTAKNGKVKITTIGHYAVSTINRTQ